MIQASDLWKTIDNKKLLRSISQKWPVGNFLGGGGKKKTLWYPIGDVDTLYVFFLCFLRFCFPICMILFLFLFYLRKWQKLNFSIFSKFCLHFFFVCFCSSKWQTVYCFRRKKKKQIFSNLFFSFLFVVFLFVF